MSEPEEYLKIAEKVKSGEYFRETRQMYDLNVHDPMSERYFYIIITTLAVLIFIMAMAAMQGLYPLKRSVPFIVNANDIVEDLPRIKSLITIKGETPSESLLKFMVSNYVIMRERYAVNLIDHDTGGVLSQSSDQVANDYQHLIDPHNPESPTALYERHSKRTIMILSMRHPHDDPLAMEVIYDADIEAPDGVKKTRWQVNIAFNYSGIALDHDTGKVKPVGFTVTQYKTRRLQDIQ